MFDTSKFMVVKAVEGRRINMPGRGFRPVPSTPTVVPRNQLYITAVAHDDLEEVTGDEADKLLADLSPQAPEAEPAAPAAPATPAADAPKSTDTGSQKASGGSTVPRMS